MKRFEVGGIEITSREIIASISIVAAMLIIGFYISGKIQERQMDKNQIYNKAIRIEDADLFQYGMDTNVGNAFVYGDLEAVDTVSYPEIEGEYTYIEKVKERYEKYEREVTVKDKDGKEHKEKEEYYQWDVEDRESLHSKEISFLGIVFPYEKIKNQKQMYIDTISASNEWSWKSGEFVRVRYIYYGTGTKYTGTIFSDLRDGTISDNTEFYYEKNIAETVEYLKSGGGVILFWVAWVLAICGCVVGFYSLENKWLE